MHIYYYKIKQKECTLWANDILKKNKLFVIGVYLFVHFFVFGIIIWEFAL